MMDYKINNNVSNDENDWRFRWQDEYLMNVPLKFVPYTRWSESWDHDHCEFCWATFSEYDGDLHEGYNTLDGKRWICERCFNDFNHMFNWNIVS